MWVCAVYACTEEIVTSPCVAVRILLPVNGKLNIVVCWYVLPTGGQIHHYTCWKNIMELYRDASLWTLADKKGGVVAATSVASLMRLHKSVTWVGGHDAHVKHVQAESLQTLIGKPFTCASCSNTNRNSHCLLPKLSPISQANPTAHITSI